MEVAGLVLGAVSVVGLAGLFDTCLHLADHISAAVHMSESADLLVRKWSVTRSTLRIWSDAVGIRSGALAEDHHSCLDKQNIRDEVLKVLIAIERLLRSPKKLVQRYGLNLNDSEHSLQNQPGVHSSSRRDWQTRLRWVLHDETKFITLIDDLAFFVERLYLLVPPEKAPSSADRKIEQILKNQTLIELSGKSEGAANASQIQTLVQAIKALQEEAKNWPSAASVTRCDELLQNLTRCLSAAVQKQNGFSQDLQAIREVIGQSAHVLLMRNQATEETTTKMMKKLSRIQAEYDKSLDILKGMERRDILNWIGAVHTRTAFENASKRCPDTCEWLVRDTDFLTWAGLGPGSYETDIDLLWIHGAPGSGKTFLAARMVEYFQKSCTLPFAYFFCTFDERSRNTDMILRSWICQIAFRERKALEIVYEAREGNELQSPTTFMLWCMFDKIIGAVPDCRFLVDGFDECLRSDPVRADHMEDLRVDFITNLIRLLKGDHHKIKPTARVCLMSREVNYVASAIAASISRAIQMRLCMDLTGADVRQFANQMVGKQLATKSSALQASVASKLASKAQGMFLWVRLETPRLKPRMTMQQLEQTLEDMPKGNDALSRLYDRCLEQILNQQEPTDVKRSLNVLRWTLYEQRPLSISQLMDVLDFSEKLDEDYEPAAYEQKDLLSFRDEVFHVCQPFLRFSWHHPSGGFPYPHFRFTHFSVKEYLMRVNTQLSTKIEWLPFANEASNHRYCADQCIAYLSLRVFALGEVEVSKKLRSGSFSFLEYATLACAKHLQYCQELLTSGTRLFSSFELIPNLHLWSRLWVSLSYLQKDGPKIIMQQKVSSFIPPLWFSAILGLSSMTEYLVERQNSPTQYADVYVLSKGRALSEASCLLAAILGGHSKLAQYLFKTMGAKDAERPCCQLLGRIHSSDDSIMIVGQMFEIATTPLSMALWLGLAEVAAFLIEGGVNIDSPSPDYLPPILQAVHHRSIVEALLERGVNVDACYGRFGTALQSATEAKSISVIRLLLKHGADVNAVSLPRGTALTVANAVVASTTISDAKVAYDLREESYLGWDLRNVLIEAGAIPGMISYPPATFQDAANFIIRRSVDGTAGIIGDDAKQLALQMRKDFSNPNFRDQYGCTSLHHLCRNLRHTPWILARLERLLREGVEINEMSSGGSALEFLIQQRDKISHIALLLRAGANPRLLRPDCLQSLKDRRQTRFLFAAGRWIEIPTPTRETAPWNATEFDKVDQLLTRHGRFGCVDEVVSQGDEADLRRNAITPALMKTRSTLQKLEWEAFVKSIERETEDEQARQVIWEETASAGLKVGRFFYQDGDHARNLARFVYCKDRAGLELEVTKVEKKAGKRITDIQDLKWVQAFVNWRGGTKAGQNL